MKNVTALLFCILIVTPGLVQADPGLCSAVFAEEAPKTLSPAGSALMLDLNSVEAKGLVNPENSKLNWYDFEALKALKKQVVNYNNYLQTISPAQREYERQYLQEAIEQSPSVSALLKALAQPPQFVYKATDYDLRRQYISQIIEIIRVLPPEFRPEIGRLKYDARLAKLNSDAISLVQGLEQRFDAMFEQTEGQSYVQWEKNLRASQDPLVQKAIALIEQDQIEVVMRRPENGRFWIPKVGFQNQYISGSSKGVFSPGWRHNVETAVTGLEPEQYWPLDDELKPKYGSLMAKPENGLDQSNTVIGAYGSDLYIFKEQSLEGRLTYSPGDSLNYIPAQNRRVYQKLGTWNGYLIPWSRRLLMVPFMLEQLKDGKFSCPSRQACTDFIKVWKFYSHDHHYWESEIFGRVDLDMVKTFIFEKQPPEGEFLQELKKRHIKIMDGRQQPAKEWVEDAK